LVICGEDGIDEAVEGEGEEDVEDREGSWSSWDAPTPAADPPHGHSARKSRSERHDMLSTREKASYQWAHR